MGLFLFGVNDLGLELRNHLVHIVDFANVLCLSGPLSFFELRNLLLKLDHLKSIELQLSFVRVVYFVLELRYCFLILAQHGIFLF